MLMYQVDAFADRVFAGNPAAVLVLDQWLADDLMLNIAEENNLAETAFVCRSKTSDEWELRWFTPVHEVDFCGHATLAAAHVLVRHFGETGPLQFNTRAGTLYVSVDGDGYELNLPRFEPEPLAALPKEIGGLFGAEPKSIFRNFENIFVQLEHEAAVRGFVPDAARIATLFPLGLAITARGEEFDFVSRYFAPGAGIPEDPVTGSIHATLVPYWAKQLGRTDLSAYQASRRGGYLRCRQERDRVLIRGSAVTFMEADINLQTRGIDNR
ncbi:MAG: PhzF family phenazine biosynthesis protein [Rhizobiaceae bacterium]|nr:PhzF family phenazine biosynthesis protein [Rhizobiaceae bacterium]